MDYDSTTDVGYLARKVKAAYFLEQRLFHIRTRGLARNYTPTQTLIKQWDGGTDSRGVRHTPIWSKIVKRALEHGLDPTLLIKVIFEKKTGGQAPYPTLALATEALEAARTYRHEMTEHLGYKMKAFYQEALTQLMILKRAHPTIPEGDLWREILTSPTITAGPIFRLVMACERAQSDIVRKIWHSAMMEYIQSPEAYDDVLGNNLPQRFREGARQYVDKVLEASC